MNSLYEFRLIARYENTSNLPIYLETCRPGDQSPAYSITLAEDPPNSSSAYSPIGKCWGSNDLVLVQPGEMRIDTITARGTNGVNSLTHASHPTEGRLLLLYGVRLGCTAASCRRAPDSLSISNTFVVLTER